MALASLALVCATASLACATATRMEGAASFPEAIRLYRLSEGSKALAVAADEGGRRAWGVYYGSPSQERANEKALEECAANAARSGIGAACHLFAVGDEMAADTLRQCAAGRIGTQRCALQQKYGW